MKKNKLMGDLKQDTCSITGLAVSTFCATVTQVLKNFQCIVNKLVTLSTMDVHYHSYATRVMLVGTVVQSICLHLLMFL